MIILDIVFVIIYIASIAVYVRMKKRGVTVRKGFIIASWVLVIINSTVFITGIMTGMSFLAVVDSLFGAITFFYTAVIMNWKPKRKGEVQPCVYTGPLEMERGRDGFWRWPGKS